jgi:predicted DNA-binding transcriptional regulator AlpA
VTITDSRLREMVRVLGDGATAEMGQRVLDWLDSRPAAPAPPPVHPAGIPPENILGLAEVAQVVGKPTPTVRTWIAKEMYSFPDPVAHLASTKIWDREQVDTWVMGNADLLGGADGH